MTLFKRLLSMHALLAAVLVAGCGGGGGSPGSGSGGTGGGGGGGSATTVADLDVTLSAATIPNTGTGTVTATITALDSNRTSVSGASVTVSANSGAVLTITSTSGSVTDSSGRITATVAIGSDHTNRDITVSATANGVTRSAVLKVVSTSTGSVPASIELIANATSIGTGGDGVVVKAFVKDTNNNALPSTPVSFSTSTGTLTGVSTATDTTGVANATISAGADKSNRVAVLTVSSGTITSTLSLPITGTKLTLSGPTSFVRGTTGNFDVLVTDSKGNAVSSVTVQATSSLGNPLAAPSGTSTNVSGVVRYTYTATNPGSDSLLFSGAGASVAPTDPVVISAQNFAFVSPSPGDKVSVNTDQVVRVRLLGVSPVSGNVIDFAATGGVLSASSATTDGNGEATVTLRSASAGPVTVQATVHGSSTSTSLPLVIVATNPARLVLQITPTAIAPNVSTDTDNQAQVVAKVTDAAGNPVQGQVVNFTRVADPSGGNLLQASAATDSSGQATVAYRAGSESTASNGVVLSAAVASNLSVSGTATLTVNQTALFIALGTGNVITNLDPQTYRKDWVVYVTDSNGIPVNGVTLTIKAIPTNYLVGQLAWNGTVWAYASPIYLCRNEDADTNGTLGPNEDDNGDGVLWPGNVIGVSPGTVQTVNGRATISLTYAESYAPWVELRLTASATVSGTESKTDAVFIVDGLAADFSAQAAPPAGVVSPFGRARKPGAVCSQYL